MTSVMLKSPVIVFKALLTFELFLFKLSTKAQEEKKKLRKDPFSTDIKNGFTPDMKSMAKVRNGNTVQYCKRILYI